MSKQIDMELENLKEENYQLKLKLQNVKETYSMENEYLKEELEKKDADQKEIIDKIKLEFKTKENNYKERLNVLEDDLTNFKTENEKGTLTIDQLQKRITLLENLQVNSSQRADLLDSLRIKNDSLEEKLAQSESMLEKFQSQILEYSKWRTENDRTLRDLKEENESKDTCISQLNRQIRTMEKEHEEEILQFQQVIQQRAEDSIDPNKRGNSLFSEVDTRRIKVEDELTRLRKRVISLTEQNTSLQKKLDQGDQRKEVMITELQRVIKSEDDLMVSIRKIKSQEYTLCESYKDRCSALRDEYKKKLLQYKYNNQEPPYLGELETIREERDRLIIQKMAQDRDVLFLQREIKINQQQNTQAEANCRILRMKLDELLEKRRKEMNCLTTNGINTSSNNSSMVESDNSLLQSPAVGGTPKSNENFDPLNNSCLYKTLLQCESPTKEKEKGYCSSPESPVIGNMKKTCKIGQKSTSTTSKSVQLEGCNQQ